MMMVHVQGLRSAQTAIIEVAEMKRGQRLKKLKETQGKGCRVGRERVWGVMQLYEVDSEGRNEQ